MIADPELTGSELFWNAIKALLGGVIVLIMIIVVSLVIGSAMRDTKTKRIEELLDRIDARDAGQYQRATEMRLEIKTQLDRIEKAMTK